jgi:D-3-phosphoglycerate dehydrogenase
MEELLSRADVVSLHLALNDETEGFISEKEIGLMKPGACLINTARGRIVEKDALVRALDEGRIRAGIDVFDQEPIPHDDPLLRTPGSLLTPHIAFKTNEALLRRVQVTAQNIRSFLDGTDVNRIV